MVREDHNMTAAAGVCGGRRGAQDRRVDGGQDAAVGDIDVSVIGKSSFSGVRWYNKGYFGRCS